MSIRGISGRVLLCALALLAGGACDSAPSVSLLTPAAPAASLQELDAQIGTLLADARIPGASVAVIEGGRVVWATPVFEGMRQLLQTGVVPARLLVMAFALNILYLAVAGAMFARMLLIVRRRGLLTRFVTQ